MAKPKHIILTEEGVITQEALVAYAQGRLGPEEVAQVDKLLRDDPFAQEALDGIRNSSAAAEMDTAVSAINTRLREKAGMREKKRKGVEIHWATYAYAAMIVGVLLGLGFVMVHFMQQSDTTVAMNKTTPQAEESAPMTEQKPDEAISKKDTVTEGETQMPATATDTTVQAKTQNAVSASTSAVSNGSVSTTPPASAKTPSTTGNTILANTTTEKRSQPMQTTAAPVAKPIGTDEAAYKADGRIAPAAAAQDKSADLEEKVVTQSKAEAKKDKANGVVADQMKEARALFDAGDFKEAGKRYSKVLSDQPDNMDALFFGGICEYKNGKLKPAEKNFDKLIKSGQYVDGSKWYKANVLIDRGKKNEAQILLKELSTFPNPYKDRAVKKFEEIQK